MFKRFRGIFTYIILALLVLAACGNKEVSSVQSLDGSDTPVSGAVDTVIKVPDTEGNSKEISIRSKKVTVYTIDNDQVVPKTSMVVEDEELRPESVIDLVMLELDDLIADDVISKVKEDGDSIIVDFTVTDKAHPFGKKSQVSEMKVLECISYSILDNFTDYKKIYFKLNGEAYISKQLKLPKNKPFMADE